MQRQGQRFLLFAALVGLLPLALVRVCEARIEAEALIGRPFGVGRVTISGLDVAIDANRVSIEEKNGRVFYPAVSQGCSAA